MKNRYFLLVTFFLLFFGYSVSAQITADSVPPGMYAVNPYAALSVGPCTTSDTVAFDINCDGNNDMALLLYKGATVIDGANFSYLIMLNDSFEVCKDTSGMFSGYSGRPHYYNAGDPLVCPVNAEWANDTIYQFGDYGCMSCSGPYSQTNVFIALRKLGQVSWMKVSFNLIDGGSCVNPITAAVQLVLSPCLASDVAEVGGEDNFEVNPNPFSEATVLYTSRPMKNGTLVIYNSYGQVVRKENNLTGDLVNVQRGDLPAGIYFLSLSDEGQFISTRKVVATDH